MTLKEFALICIGSVCFAMALNINALKEVHQNMFTNKKDALSAAKKQIKAEITMLKERLKELRCE